MTTLLWMLGLLVTVAALFVALVLPVLMAVQSLDRLPY